MIAPLTFGKCQLNVRSIALAATVAILMSIAPHVFVQMPGLNLLA